MAYSELETEFNSLTDTWLESNLGISQTWVEPLFHFTSSKNSNSIVESQIFWASFIRSTSDPLEFVLPLSEVRDWVCFSRQLFSNFDDPYNFFNHFNELAENPPTQIRPYFISMVKEPNDHLMKRYGNSIIKVVNQQAVDFKKTIFMVPINYYENVQLEIRRLLMDWRNNVLLKAQNQFNEIPENQFVKETLYLWMKTFSMLALSIKKNVYRPEQEVRIVAFAGTPDENTSWFDKRIINPSDTPEFGFPRKEYLPIKIGALGLKADFNKT